MRRIHPIPLHFFLLVVCSMTLVNVLALAPQCHAAADTVIVSAEGLADPQSDALKNNQSALSDALLSDATKQALEKVVGLFMDDQQLAKHYTMIDKEVLANDKRFIKEILQKSEPWQGGDGFMHILIKAAVHGDRVEKTLQEISRKERTKLIRQAGNPRITVAITVRDAERSSETKPERSAVAENILKEYIAGFGYRVWSENGGEEKNTALAGQSPDFSIQGEAKFKPVHLTLQTSGIEINKITITSWTVKCTDNVTGEEIYFNNKIPARRSWSNEDTALAAIGELIGGEFSKEFFEKHLLQRTKMYQLIAYGLPSYDTAILFKKELIGLRPVMNVELRSFDNKKGAVFEVEFSASGDDFSQTLNNSVLKPLNAKFGKNSFQLASVRNLEITVNFHSSERPADVAAQFEEKPPSSLATASPVRLNQVAATRGALDKVGEINPQGAKKVLAHRRSGGKTSLDASNRF